MLIRLVLAGFLVAHAAIHTGFVSRRPVPTPGAPPWPFELSHSWLLSPLRVNAAVLRVLGTVLLFATVIGYGVGAVAAVGVLGSGAWLAGVAIGTVGSLALLLLFFHPWLAIAIAIDLVLAWLVLRSGWTPAEIAP